MTASYSLTLAFAGFLLAGIAVKFWLASRQIRHVARHRDAVPPAFAATVSLAAHQTAADYTITKTRFGLLELAFGAAVLPRQCAAKKRPRVRRGFNFGPANEGTKYFLPQ